MRRIGARGEDAAHAAHGQIVAMFALMLMVLLGMVGVAIDLTHARTTAEEIQHAADAAALAGVVYLPEASNSTVAQDTAAAAAAANGYPNGSTTQITYVPDSPNRKLKVTITTQVSTPFLRVIGRGTISVVRSAVATYADPVAMGAPDHMLGFAPYPTSAFNDTNPPGYYPQGFYLQLKGSYGGLEHGDAFTPYFQVSRWSTSCTNKGGSTVSPYSGNCSEHLVNTDGSIVQYKNPCTSTTGTASYNDICKDTGNTSHTMVHNPYYNQQNGTSGQLGYNYIFQLPPNMSHSVLLKVNDPLDECSLDTSSAYTTLSPPPNSSLRYEYVGSEANYSGSTVSAGSTYKDSGGTTYTVNYPTVHALLDGQIASGTVLQESTTRLDQCDAMYVNNQYRPNTLEFTIYTPALRAAENTSPAAVTYSNGQPTVNTTTTGSDVNASVTVGYNPIYTGSEFSANQQTCYANDHNFSIGGGSYGTSCFLVGSHAFNWLTIGSAINSGPVPAYIRVTVQSAMNSSYWSNDSKNGFAGYGAVDTTTFATGGNVFSLALCDTGPATGAISSQSLSDTDPASHANTWYGDIFDSNNWEAADTTGKNPDLHCPDPNADAAFASDVSNGFRFQVNGREAMCIMTMSVVPNGYTNVSDFIPLAEVGSHFAGSSIVVRLFDPGDVSSAKNFLSILGPGNNPSGLNFTQGTYTSTEYTGGNAAYAYPSGSSFESWPYQLSLSSPTGSHYSDSGTQRPPWWCGTGLGSSDYDADNPPSGNAALCPPTGQNPIDQGVQVADPNYNDPVTQNGYANDYSNDVWLEFHITLPATYSPQVGKDWWKVAYNLVNGASDDTTTWQVVSGSAPVHLLTGE